MQGGNWKTRVELPAGLCCVGVQALGMSTERTRAGKQGALGLKATQVNTQNHATKTQEQIQVMQLSEKGG